MSGGDLPGTFIFVEAEFHTSMRGQNLKIDLIHFNSKYLTFEQSKKHPDGLAIISIFFNIGIFVRKSIKTVMISGVESL